jgi:hypothetical protein
MNHFYFGTEINGINVSGKSVAEVNELMAAELQAYALNIIGKLDKNEQIKAEEIGLKYNLDGEFKSFKDRQNPYNWISVFFYAEASKMTEAFKYDDELLKARLDRLSIFDEGNILEPENPGFKYANNSYVIVDEIDGNKVDKDILYERVLEAILRKEAEIDLEAADCYVKPRYTSQSQKVIETRDLLNKYVSSRITYIFGEQKEILDGPIINNWITIDENYTVTLDEEKAKEYINKLSETYNTIGNTRNFITSSGKTIDIRGGDYGWYIDTAKETEAMLAAVKEGQTIEKEPAYSQTGLSYGSNGIGNTYVEIDMTKQRLWFYKNGALVTQGDVVTGNVSEKNTTPKGVYKLKSKQRHAVLRGRDYASPVTFWMPFNRGIGIHDASWRNEFGGTIY